MPTYEYRCEKCGEFEYSQRITAPALQRCPTCKRKVRRLISNTSFQLKGGGWYVTDYARAGKGGEGSGGKDSGTDSAKETGATSDSSATSSSTAETKSESKSDKKRKSDTKAASAGA